MKKTLTFLCCLIVCWACSKADDFNPVDLSSQQELQAEETKASITLTVKINAVTERPPGGSFSYTAQGHVSPDLRLYDIQDLEIFFVDLNVGNGYGSYSYSSSPCGLMFIEEYSEIAPFQMFTTTWVAKNWTRINMISTNRYKASDFNVVVSGYTMRDYNYTPPPGGGGNPGDCVLRKTFPVLSE